MLYEVITHATTDADLVYLNNPNNQPPNPNGLGDLTWEYQSVTLYPFGTPVPADVNHVITSYSIHYTKLYDMRIEFTPNNMIKSHANSICYDKKQQL